MSEVSQESLETSEPKEEVLLVEDRDELDADQQADFDVDVKVVDGTELHEDKGKPKAESKPDEAGEAEKKEVTAQDGKDSGPVAEKAAKEDWRPNYKFKFDKEEKEIDDWAKPFVTKENQDKVIDLFQRASALDGWKAKHQEVEQRATQVTRHLEEYAGKVQKALSYAEKDFGRFLREADINPQAVLGWLQKEAEKAEFLAREDVPESVKREYTNREAERIRLEQLEEANLQMSASAVDSVTQARQRELSDVLNRAEIKAIISEYDASLGREGAFEEMVKRHGKYEWERSNGQRDLNAEEAVGEVLRSLRLSPAVTPPRAAEAAKPNEVAATPKVITDHRKATVIPNVGSGSAASATVKRPKSLDDLRQMAKETQAGR